MIETENKGCRIGMTTNPHEAKEYWQARYRDLSDWRVIAAGLSKTQALMLQLDYLEQHACRQVPLDLSPEDPSLKWTVFGFNHCNESEILNEPLIKSA